MEESENRSEPKLVTHGSIHEAVANKIKGIGPAVEDALVDGLVQHELNRRVQIAQTGLKTISSLKADIAKINRGDIRTYDRDGNEELKYSEERHKKLKQSKEQLEKLENAFNKALNENSGEAYGKLEELSKNSGGGKPQATAES